MSPMGRPKSENPKATQITVRLDKESLRKLDTCAKQMNETRVQIIRRGIENVFSELNKQDAALRSKNATSYPNQKPKGFGKSIMHEILLVCKY